MTKRVEKGATGRKGCEGDSVIVVVTTVGTEEQALDIAHHLVRNRLAACVNVFPQIRSVYHWEGKTCDDSELLLLIKTSAANFDRVKDAIGELHAYELPEILGFPAVFAEKAFAAWVVEASCCEPVEDEVSAVD